MALRVSVFTWLVCGSVFSQLSREKKGQEPLFQGLVFGF